MKEMKRTFLALIAAVMVIFASVSLPVLAGEGDEGYDPTAGYTEDAGERVPAPIAAENQTQPVTTGESGQARAGVSFTTVFLMFALGIVINAAISFVIANRFYGMSKKDSHLQAEIRALRRDIDEKFIGSVKEIKETAATVTNSNKDYSKGGITYKDEAPAEELSEIAKRWNIDIEEEAEPDVKIRTTRRFDSGRNVRSTQTKRSAASERLEQRRAARMDTAAENIDADEDVSDSVKSKAKKFLGDIFPFEEE